MSLNVIKVGKDAPPPLLMKFWAWIVGLTALSLIYTLTMTYVFKANFPYGLPIFDKDEPYTDFTIFYERFLHFRTPSFWDAFNYPFTYPAPTGVIFALLYRLPHELFAYLALIVLLALLGGFVLATELIKRGISRPLAFCFVATVLLTSWPLGFLLNRANIEGFVAIVLAGGVVAILRRDYWLGASLVGLAGSMKLFPLVLLALLLSKRRYKEFAWGIVVAVLATLGSLEALGPNLREAQLHISDGLRFFQNEYALKMLRSEVGFDHSLFPLVKIPLVVLYGYFHHHLAISASPDGSHGHLGDAASGLIQVALRLYLGITAVAGTVAYCLWIRKLPMLNQVLVLTVCAVVLPPVSYDYTLIHMLLPFGLLCVYTAELWRNGDQARGLTSCFACFAVIFTAEAYLTVGIRFAGQVRAICLLALLIFVMRYRFAWRALEEAN